MQGNVADEEPREVSHPRIPHVIRTGSLNARQFSISVPDSYRSLAPNLMTEIMTEHNFPHQPKAAYIRESLITGLRIPSFADYNISKLRIIVIGANCI